MRFPVNFVLVMLMVLLMALAMVSFAANPGPPQIDIIPDFYLNQTDGIYYVNLTVSVSDDLGNPVADGTMVDFSVKGAGTPYNVTSTYNPILTGGLNGNSSRRVFVPTSGGKAVARFGWFPDNKIPSGQLIVTASLNSTPSIKSEYTLVFNGTTQVLWASAPVICPLPPASPIPPVTMTQQPVTTQSPTPTPLSLMVNEPRTS